MAQTKNRRKRLVTLVAVAGLTVAGTGVAFAYWTADGTGSGAAQTGESVALVISSDPATGPLLSPGGLPGQTVAFHVLNPGTGTERLANVNVRVGEANGDPWATTANCSAADYTVSITDSPAPVAIDPDGTVDGVATIVMRETGDNQNGCQNLEVPLYFSTELVAT
jgi:hypothetical protein